MRFSVDLFTLFLICAPGGAFLFVAFKALSLEKSILEWSKSQEGLEICEDSSKNLRIRPSASSTNLPKENVFEWVSSTLYLNELDSYTSGFYECITLSWRAVNHRIKNTSELVDDLGKQSIHSLVVLFHFDENPTKMESFLLEPVEYRKQHPELLRNGIAVLDNKFYSVTPTSLGLNESISTMINFSGAASNTCLLFHESAGIDGPLPLSKRNGAAVIRFVVLLLRCTFSIFFVAWIVLEILIIFSYVLENRENYRTIARSSMAETQV